MSLEMELNIEGYLNTDHINGALRSHDVAEITQFIRLSDNFESFKLVGPPVNEELGRHVSDAIVYNSHISRIFFDNERAAIRDLVAWIASHDTLVNMTSLVYVKVCLSHVMSELDCDCDALFPLLLTSTSLHSFEISVVAHGTNGCIDNVMSALSWYLGAASLREFTFHSGRVSDAVFTSLWDGVASSTVRKFTLCQELLQKFNPQTAAESLARMIVASSLEEVRIHRPFGVATSSIWIARFISALKLTAPVRNLDFSFTQIGNYPTHLRINQKWKSVVSANTPLALWPHILKKSHASPEASHGSAGILFYLLREKPDLVPVP
jgi:hypothetical protein